MMSGAQTQQKYQEGIRAIGAGNFNRAQQIVDELNRGKRPQQAQQLSQQLQQAQARVPSAPTTPPPTGLLDSCDQQVDALLRYFGRYPVGQPINRDKRVATKDLLIDTYNLLEAIGIPRQTTAGGFGLPVSFGPGGTSIPDFYGFGDVLNMIKQRVDVLSGIPGAAAAAAAVPQELLAFLNLPKPTRNNIITYINGVTIALKNAGLPENLGGLVKQAIATEKDLQPLFGFFNAIDLKTALFNLNNFQTVINAAFPAPPTAVGTPATAQNLDSLHNFIMQFGDINTIQGVLNFLSDGLGNPANDLATAITNIQAFLTHISNAGFSNWNNLTQLGNAIPTSTLKATEKNNLLIIKQQLTKMNMPNNGPAVHNWFTNLNQQDQQLAFDLFVQNAVILVNSNIQ
jgi:hypothetical protein